MVGLHTCAESTIHTHTHLCRVHHELSGLNVPQHIAQVVFLLYHGQAVNDRGLATAKAMGDHQAGGAGRGGQGAQGLRV